MLLRNIGSKTKQSGWVSRVLFGTMNPKFNSRKIFFLVVHSMKFGIKRSLSSAVSFATCRFSKRETKQKSARRAYHFPAVKKHVSLSLEQFTHQQRSSFLTM